MDTVEPTFLCKQEIFQSGMKRNIIGANIDKGIFFIILLNILNSFPVLNNSFPVFAICTKVFSKIVVT